MEYCGSFLFAHYSSLPQTSWAEYMSPCSVNVMFGHVTCFGKWNITEHVSSRDHEKYMPQRACWSQKKETHKKAEVPQSTRVKSKRDMSQLTWRPVNMIVKAHCYIPLNLGIVCYAATPDHYNQLLYVPCFAKHRGNTEAGQIWSRSPWSIYSIGK